MNIDNEKRRVAIYARVSTEHEGQKAALENQKLWYEPFFEIHQEWELYQLYTDEGITGTSVNKREAFIKMMEDARRGKFDLIVTREVSRFARNTVDTLQYTRELKKHNVEVFFINDNIKTFDSDGELRLTIMATLAQDESRKIAQRVNSGIKTSIDKGVIWGNGNVLGYKRENGKMVVDEEQAKTVRQIFQMCIDGYTLREIQLRLEYQGTLTAMNNTNWYCSNISRILNNPIYIGKQIHGQSYSEGYLSQKRIINKGEKETVISDIDIEKIITEEQWNEAQIQLKSRSKNVTKGARHKTVWGRIGQCECGRGLYRAIWNRYIKKGATDMLYGYDCSAKTKMGTKKQREEMGLEYPCRNTRRIPEWKLDLGAKYIIDRYDTKIEKAAERAIEIIEHYMSANGHNDKPKEIQCKITKIRNKLNVLKEMRLDGDIDRVEYLNRKTTLEDEIKLLQRQLELCGEEKVPLDKKLEAYHEKMLEYKHSLSFSLLPENIVEALFEKVVIHPDSVDYYLRLNDDQFSINIEGRKTNPKVVELPLNVVDTTGCNRKFTAITDQFNYDEIVFNLGEFTIPEKFTKKYAEVRVYKRTPMILKVLLKIE